MNPSPKNNMSSPSFLEGSSLMRFMCDFHSLNNEVMDKVCLMRVKDIQCLVIQRSSASSDPLLKGFYCKVIH